MRVGFLFVLLACWLAPTAWAGIVVLDLGHAPPPAMVGPYPMTPANTAVQAAIPDHQSPLVIPGLVYGRHISFLGGTITKLTVPDSWPAWGRGYRGPVFVLDEVTEYNGRFSDSVAAIYFYLRPRSGSATIELLLGEQSTGPVVLDAADGARGFAIYATEGKALHGLDIDVLAGAGGVGVAELGTAGRSAACVVGAIALGQTVEGAWSGDCSSAHLPYRRAQYLAFDLEEATAIEVELEGGLDPEAAVLEGRGTTGNQLEASSRGEGSVRLTAELGAGTYTLEARESPEDGSVLTPFTLRLNEIAGVCRSSATTACIDVADFDRRFAVDVFYASFNAGQSGAAQLADSYFDRGGIFYFFNRQNPEVMVKVLDGCPVNGHYWVFVSAVTNVGFMVTVEDTVTGEEWTYDNPDQHVAVPRQDVRAFACDAAGGLTSGVE